MNKSGLVVLVLSAALMVGMWRAYQAPPTRDADAAELPEGWFQSLPRDAILPVYDPSFDAGSDVNWPLDALVIGVEVGGDARAYPVAYLNRREMVNDVVGGEPLLVSW